MPEFLFRWLKALIFFLNQFLGNIGFVKWLKDMVTGVDKPPAFISLFPIAFVIAVGLVIWLLFVTRILGPRKPRTQKAVK
ncbi:MAG TPA: hypothetical protein PK747_06435 [Acidobacteriota bacterium]|nr:hypothetical protein [Acidobacteriota bacterium]HNT17003.1 hypothetical protein [Acidobacteriota bacterium]HPA27199.1 hypothetical protein [Acidobacteriota bacterium]HQO20336.1 hypothetical protein [Acidobacteriota bacterium]HQQ47030.1 hypothetical protein [Acidobacteriota bacterium]